MRFENPAQLGSRLGEKPGPSGRRLRVCGGPGCLAAGGGRVLASLRGLAGGAAGPTGCLGLCERGPLVLSEPEGFLYERVAPEDAGDLAAETLGKGLLVERLVSDPAAPLMAQNPFHQGQERLITRRFGLTDPESFDDYLRTGGWRALHLALSELGPEGVLERIEASGLRGRGGGGFGAGRKWRAVREAPGERKYLLANGDEGDPGAFMNRALMEGDPLAVIEGMILGAYAVGASHGIIYVRHEYPLSVERLGRSIRAARERGLLGQGILGTDFSFEIEVAEGGGAFVCGESTALMASLEGREGLPRTKYVRSSERGLWDCPTLLQNVETWANVPPIVESGPQWFRSLGTPGSPGTKVFSLVGQVRRSGLVEAPLGVSLRSVVEGAGGGARPGRTIKAVQTGGPSGGCLPAAMLDLPLDFDSLQAAGTIMGSGGLIVMDDLSCMVDVARYFTGFLKSESCGKCAPCREGLAVLHGLLDDLCQGLGRPGHANLIGHLAEQLSKTALCGLGKSAANPILSTLRHFPEEYLEHEAGFCRSGRCQGLFAAAVDPDRCAGCGACQKICPAGAIGGSGKMPRSVAPGACVSCGSCLGACRFGAVSAERRAA
jgi:NADH-quinone oxidoreductase subunit F